MKKLITLLSTLTITSSIMPLTVACKTTPVRKPLTPETNSNKRELNINEITVDMIINWKNEYLMGNDNDGYKIIEPEKLGSLESQEIIAILNSSLENIIHQKLSGIDKTEFDYFLNDNIDKITDTELSNLIISALILDTSINYDINPINEQNTKKFTANIEVKEWEAVRHKIEDEFNKTQKNMQEFLSSYDKGKKTKILTQDMNDDQTQQEINYKIKYANILLKISFDSFKPMYDLIIGTNATIEIDLTDKQ